METISELAALMAEGGLDAANRVIASLLEEISAAGLDGEAWLLLLQRLNKLLYDAIYVCPQTVRGIDVVFRSGLYERVEELELRYDAFNNLQPLQGFAAAWSKEQDDPVPETLCLPLPCAAQTLMREELVFGKMSTREGLAHPVWGREVPCLQIAISEPRVTYTHTYVPLDEIQAIRFTPRSEYAPYLLQAGQGRSYLSERGSHLQAYLTFRGFRLFGNYRSREQLPALNEMQWALCQRLLMEPQALSNLWLHDDTDPARRRMKQALIVARGMRPEDYVLYEIIDADLPDSDYHAAAALWFVECHGTATLPDKIRRYQEDEILSRLAQIPVPVPVPVSEPEHRL